MQSKKKNCPSNCSLPKMKISFEIVIYSNTQTSVETYPSSSSRSSLSLQIKKNRRLEDVDPKAIYPIYKGLKESNSNQCKFQVYLLLTLDQIDSWSFLRIDRKWTQELSVSTLQLQPLNLSHWKSTKQITALFKQLLPRVKVHWPYHNRLYVVMSVTQKGLERAVGVVKWLSSLPYNTTIRVQWFLIEL